MKKIVLLVLVCFSFVGYGQSLKKYVISSSGCSAYFFCAPSFESSKSEDSSAVYSGECMNDSVSYGIICVKLLNPIADLTMAEDLLIAYSDYLKSSFSITKAIGYGKGHRLNNNENTRGIIDYWEDNEGDKWKIKAWTDGKYIGFLYVYSHKALPETKVNVFLEGFRLPGM